jgi:ubiquinone/menaquinone biosynthesis C-methylase UbiE
MEDEESFLNKSDGCIKYDEDASKRLLAVYTTPDVEQQRAEFLNSIDLKLNDTVLDVGSGPGFLSKAMTQKGGPKGKVCGIDISEYLLELAKTKCKGIQSIAEGG